LEHLPSNCKALGSIPSAEKKKKDLNQIVVVKVVLRGQQSGEISRNTVEIRAMGVGGGEESSCPSFVQSSSGLAFCHSLSQVLSCVLAAKLLPSPGADGC
jgi:hypothetical protein